MSKIDVGYKGNLRCELTQSQSQAKFMTDGLKEDGGLGEMFSPTDLVAAALGSCVMTVMGIVAARSKIDLAGTNVEIEKQMSDSSPRRVASLKLKIVFPAGLKLDDGQKRKLEHVVNSCPVKNSLHPDIKLDAEFLYR